MGGRIQWNVPTYGFYTHTHRCRFSTPAALDPDSALNPRGARTSNHAPALPSFPPPGLTCEVTAACSAEACCSWLRLRRK